MAVGSLLLTPLSAKAVVVTFFSLFHQRWAKLSNSSVTAREKTSGRLTVIDSRTGREYLIPIADNSIQAIEIGKIFTGDEFDMSNRMSNGLKVLDPGFSNTAVMKSRVPLVDGMQGEIHYRGHNIDRLYGEYSFEQVAHLLIWDHLPSPEEGAALTKALKAGLNPPQSVIDAVNLLPRDAPNVSLVIAGLAAYTAANPMTIPTVAGRPHMYQGNMEVIDQSVLRTISTMAVVIALTYCHQRNRAFHPADPTKTFIENVLIIMGYVEEKSGLPSPKVVSTLDRLWILYLDHEMTNSTAALLHVASTLADPLSCCIGLVAAANGPLHGGAIDLAYKEFERLGTPASVPAMIRDVKAKKMRLFGYGHRIYKTVDPRAKYLRAMLDEFEGESRSNLLLRIAMEIDRVASADEYFTSRNLKPNADLYGCFVYTALGFEQDIIACMMLLSRIPGAMAHWREAAGLFSQVNPPRIWRPQQIYVLNAKSLVS